jgi:hypothetical protein
MEARTMMKEGLNLIAFVSKDRTRLYGCLQNQDLFSHITTNWGLRPTECFKIELQYFDMLFNQNLIRCKETDSLLTVMRKMNDQRVGMISIESVSGEYTVGLCFLSDLLWLMQLPDFLFYFT